MRSKGAARSPSSRGRTLHGCIRRECARTSRHGGEDTLAGAAHTRVMQVSFNAEPERLIRRSAVRAMRRSAEYLVDGQPHGERAAARCFTVELELRIPRRKGGVGKAASRPAGRNDVGEAGWLCIDSG